MASGDKFYLADKETLDEVDEKLGSTKDTGGSSTSGSVFGKINYLVSQVSSYLATVYSWSNTILGRVGTTTDTGGTTTSGSLMAKENAILAEVNKLGGANDTGGNETAGTAMAKLNALQASIGKIGEVLDSL